MVTKSEFFLSSQPLEKFPSLPYFFIKLQKEMFLQE